MMLLLGVHAHSHQSAQPATATGTVAGRVLVCDAAVAVGLRPLDRQAAAERCPQPFTVVPENP